VQRKAGEIASGLRAKGMDRRESEARASAGVCVCVCLCVCVGGDGLPVHSRVALWQMRARARTHTHTHTERERERERVECKQKERERLTHTHTLSITRTLSLTRITDVWEGASLTCKPSHLWHELALVRSLRGKTTSAQRSALMEEEGAAGIGCLVAACLGSASEERKGLPLCMV